MSLPPGTTLFNNCTYDTLNSGGDNNLAILQCISDQYDRMQHMIDIQHMSTRNWLFISSGALVFVMQAGFAMLVGGCVRKKNLQNTMLKNLLDCCGAAVAFWSVGFSFAFGNDNEDPNTITFIGRNAFFSTNVGNPNPKSDLTGFWFFEYAFSATAVTIIAGTLAERCQMGAYLYYSIFLTGFVYPVVVHNVWSSHGIFSASIPDIEYRYRGVGCIDFAGSGVIHFLGGTISLIAAYILGPRVGRFYNAKGEKLPVPAEFKGHSMALQLLGTFILWFGWYGFNPGSALTLTHADPSALGGIAAKSAVNTSMAAASGALSAMITHLLREKFFRSGKICFDITMTMNGCLSGLVAVTSSSATVELWSACIIGIISGPIYVFGSSLLLFIMIDDAVDAIPVHMLNGLWGLLAVGLFSTPEAMKNAFGQNNVHFGWFYNMRDATLFVNQIILSCFIFAWACGTMIPFFSLLNYFGLFRSDGLEEVVGLDVRYHGGTNEIDEKQLQKELEDYKEMMTHRESVKQKESRQGTSVIPMIPNQS